jgi:hypothetical protein
MNNLEKNKLIAAFMGYPYYYEDVYHSFGGPIEGDILELGNIVCKTRPIIYESHGLRMIAGEDYVRIPYRWYDRSWDWLMPVVEKINEEIPKCIPNNVILPDYMVKMKNMYLFRFNDPYQITISEIYKCCYQFIKWYKENYEPEVAD